MTTHSPLPGSRDAQTLPAFGREGKDAALVQEMFDRVAPRYDRANAVLSLGQDAHWRRVTADAASPPGRRMLDVASGPGNIARELLKRGARRVVALDMSYNMLAEGARRGTPDIDWLNADAQAIPLPDAAIDGVTISFGLRNIPDPERALAEFARVSTPGSPLVICEFAAPVNPVFRQVYLGYLMRALPPIAGLVSSDGPAYTYLAESIRAWPDRLRIADWMTRAGYADVQVKNLSGGIVVVHRGWRR